MSTGNMTDLLDDVPAFKRHAPKHANPDGYKIVSIRLRQAEFESFSDQAQSLGLTHNLAMRIAIRRIAGFLEVDAETRHLLREVSSNIGDISINLSRLSRLAEREGNIDMRKLDEQRRAFGREFAVLDDRLQALLNISKRRIDGRTMLKDVPHP